MLCAPSHAMCFKSANNRRQAQIGTNLHLTQNDMRRYKDYLELDNNFQNIN